jgi:signal transduction histidine kinase
VIRSIRSRVVFLVLAAQLLAAASAVGFAIIYVHRALWSRFDSELQVRMVSLLALVGEADEGRDGVTFDREEAKIPEGDLFYIEDERGQFVAGSSSWINVPNRVSISPTKHWKFRRGETTYRGKALIKTPILDQENHQIPQLRVSLYYAMPANRTEAQIVNATRIAIAVGFISLVLSFGSTWLAVGRGMQPLLEFAHQADLIEADGSTLVGRKVAVNSSELMPLARALDRLGTRVQGTFQRERQFLSDAAHELKTAVTILKSTLQLLEQDEPSEVEYREGVARALEDTGRTEDLVAKMLLLSSIEHAQQVSANEFAGPCAALNDSLQAAIDSLGPIARLRSVSIDFQRGDNTLIEARESELSHLWLNLIENAIQHSAQGSRVLIEVDAFERRTCRVRILDYGTGISSQDLPHVFERFYRSDSSRSRLTGGFGLGLAIAKAVVVKNHGTIHIQSVPNAGTTVEVTFRAVSDTQV